MPVLDDIDSVLVVGSGPIVIGQAAEFDYSGSQACKALREDGFRVILINSNPATIQTDPEIADEIYIEPLTVETVENVIRREQPDGFLGTMGGQTGLNLTTRLAERNVFEDHGVRVLGTRVENINQAEDREAFGRLMRKIDEPMTRSHSVNDPGAAREAAVDIGYPVIVRPAYTLGGSGGGVAGNEEQLDTIARRGLDRSRVNQVLVEKSLLGWMEFEYELMRDKADNCIIICNMENIDPMGIHTGESIVTAPAQTLSDADHQRLRNAAIKIIRSLDVIGGCNIQFAVDPETREYSVVEVNPRVSRSSALASKVTGYPIAKIAAHVTAGRTLDEIPNDITEDTRACFEPALDYVVVKIPRWPFDRFTGARYELNTEMKSTGETMAIGRCFEEALQKAVRSLDVEHDALCGDGREHETRWKTLIERLETPGDQRIFYLYDALRAGMAVEDVHRHTRVPRFFLHKINNLVEMERELLDQRAREADESTLEEARRLGFSQDQLSDLLDESQGDPRGDRTRTPAYKMVDTCAAEFEATTPYYYSTHESIDEVEVGEDKKVMVLGGGPIRIGQGIEFDYCCVHASIALRDEGVESIMVNNNPETVSTDYDTSDRLYFEPLTRESVLDIVHKEQPDGVIVQFGGQTPLNIASELEGEVPVLGTSPGAIHRAEDRQQFAATLEDVSIPQPPFGTGHSAVEALNIAERIGYPVLVRPSFVLGGKSMTVAHDETQLKQFMNRAVQIGEEHPVLVDKFLEEAIEVDVDAVADGEDVFIGGIMEHIEEAGVHSGDSACVLPPQSLSGEVLHTVGRYTRRLARELEVKGLLNLQFAVRGDQVYLLEANPRASRTVPFVSKATGVSLVKLATRVMLGRSLQELGRTGRAVLDRTAVKEAVFPFEKIPDVDPVLGPEMKSTGEVMGMAPDFPAAYYKSQLAAGNPLPTEGRILLSVNDSSKGEILPVAQAFHGMGFEFYATSGTARVLRENGIRVDEVRKVREGDPNLIDHMVSGEIDLIINLPTSGRRAHTDGYAMRRHAIELDIPYITTLPAARAASRAIERARRGEIGVFKLSDIDPELAVG